MGNATLELRELPNAFALAAEGVQQRLHKGLQVYVSLGGRPVVDDALGEARPGVLMKPETINVWLSSSKPLTAVAIAQLVERGVVDVEAPVAAYLPAFANRGKERVTVRHILTHTSALNAKETLAESWDVSWERAVESLMEAPLEPRQRPGEVAAYEPWATWHILGEIVRVADGRPIDAYLREEMFDPLGMDDWSLGIPVAEQLKLGTRLGWMFARKGSDPLAPNERLNSERAVAAVVPGSNGRGTARSLGRFYEAMLGGGTLDGARVLTPESVARITARHRIALFDHTLQHVIDWGLGFVVNSNRYGADTVPYGYGLHASEKTFGHSGAQSSTAFCDPAHGLVAAVHFNGQPGEVRHQRRMRAFLTALYEDLGLTASAP